MSETAPRNDDRVLSPRELEILRLLVRGRPTREIAADLGISVQTVRKHTQNVLAKLQVHSKLAAAAVAVRDGLV
jgi:DNA-binding NarL/FixJ family response regulator